MGTFINKMLQFIQSHFFVAKVRIHFENFFLIKRDIRSIDDNFIFLNNKWKNQDIIF